MTLRVQADAVATLTMRLAEPLAVTSVVSNEFGRLLFFRIRNDDSLIINLPVSAQRGTVIAFDIVYSGRLPSQALDRETVAVEAQDDDTDIDSLLRSEPNFLLSSRAAWYPQNVVTDYARARIRVTVPEAYGCVASGQLSPGDVSLRDAASTTGGTRLRVQRQRAGPLLRGGRQPADARLRHGRRRPRPDDPGRRDVPVAGTSGRRLRRYDHIAINVDANPRQLGRGREIAPVAADIMRFYGTVMDDTPYESLTRGDARARPAGRPQSRRTSRSSTTPRRSRSCTGATTRRRSRACRSSSSRTSSRTSGGDRRSAGRTITSSGSARGSRSTSPRSTPQRAHGDASFFDMLRQFRRWSLAESDQGPIDLGYRLGLIQGQGAHLPRLIYNKGAVGPAHASPVRRRRGVLQRPAPLLRRAEVSGRRAPTTSSARWKRRRDGRSSASSIAGFTARTFRVLRYSSTIRPGEVVVQFDQDPKAIFDVPVTVTLQYADGRLQDVLVPVSDAHVERRIRDDRHRARGANQQGLGGAGALHRELGR